MYVNIVIAYTETSDKYSNTVQMHLSTQNRS